MLFNIYWGISQYSQVKILDSIFKAGDYEKTIALAGKYLTEYTQSRELNLYRGMALVETDNFKQAQSHLQLASQSVFDDSDTISSWALGYLACCKFMLEGDKKAKETFKDAYKANGTFHTEKFINSRSLLFGLEDFYEDWHSVNSEHIHFWFEDTLNRNIPQFVLEHEQAFDSIHSFFGGNVPRIINYLVWSNIEHAAETLYVKPAFASPVYCCVHSNFNQSLGHELAHILAWYSCKLEKTNQIIFEGVAVYFDMTDRDKIDFVKAYIRHHKLKGPSFKMLWENWEYYPEQLSYPLSGILVASLISTYGHNKFMEFFPNQSYENAISVFGAGLEQLIASLEKELQ